MRKLKVDGNKTNPSIDFDGYKGVLEITGRSIPENSIEFYKSLIDWASKYAIEPLPVTTVNIKLEYCNSFSRKFLLELLKTLKPIIKTNQTLNINWFYDQDDEDFKYEGEIFSNLTGLKINTVIN